LKFAENKKMKKLITVFTCVLLLSLPLAAADGAAGKAAYAKACKSCHGPDGAGNPAVAKMMKVEMKPLGSKDIQAKSDDELRAVIAKGAGKMKPVTSLSDDQASAVVAFIRTLKQ
jgi:mono/diheme cytochrome c family protein